MTISQTAKPKGLIIAAPASGSGKTVATLALLRCLKRSGVAVGSFKVGPDYIDPAFHTAAGASVCRNIDGWAMRPHSRARALQSAAEGAALVIGEGVMGLFDGATDGTGSTADIAAETGLPVVLVVDVRGQAASAAAVVEGFLDHRSDVKISGVIFNRVGGEGHRRTLSDAVASLPITVLGCLPRDERLVLPERHLGLVQAGEHGDLDTRLDAAADVIGDNLDLDAVTALARPLPDNSPISDGSAPLPPLGRRIAAASDEAFAFAYQGILEGWRSAGSEIAPFSPLADEAPPAGCDAVYLPGGYPELQAGRLAANEIFLSGLRKAAKEGAQIFGECGGYMVLGQYLTDLQGERHAMAGLLPLETSFAQAKLHLGYREVRLIGESPFASAESVFRGHEFHYATVLSEGGDGAKPLFKVQDARGEQSAETGLKAGNVAGSFIHLIDRKA